MRVPPCHPPADGHCHAALSPECPRGPGKRQTDRQGAGSRPRVPPGAPQGAAGDSSPSELSYVSFLLRWGLGVNQFLGAVSPGQRLSSAQAWGGGGVRGQGPGWDMGRVSPATPSSHITCSMRLGCP